MKIQKELIIHGLFFLISLFTVLVYYNNRPNEKLKHYESNNYGRNEAHGMDPVTVEQILKRHNHHLLHNVHEIKDPIFKIAFNPEINKMCIEKLEYIMDANRNGTQMGTNPRSNSSFTIRDTLCLDEWAPVLSSIYLGDVENALCTIIIDLDRINNPRYYYDFFNSSIKNMQNNLQNITTIMNKLHQFREENNTDSLLARSFKNITMHLSSFIQITEGSLKWLHENNINSIFFDYPYKSNNYVNKRYLSGAKKRCINDNNGITILDYFRVYFRNSFIALSYKNIYPDSSLKTKERVEIIADAIKSRVDLILENLNSKNFTDLEKKKYTKEKHLKSVIQEYSDVFANITIESNKESRNLTELSNKLLYENAENILFTLNWYPMKKLLTYDLKLIYFVIDLEGNGTNYHLIDRC